MNGATTSSGSANPEYVNARVRARRAALFDSEDYRKLVRMGTGEIARYMEETEYESEMNALGARHSGVDLIEYALNRNLAKHFHDMLSWADGRLYVRSRATSASSTPGTQRPPSVASTPGPTPER
jgi:V/A-type H+-transporting ATPase subunit C